MAHALVVSNIFFNRSLPHRQRQRNGRNEYYAGTHDRRRCRWSGKTALTFGTQGYHYYERLRLRSLRLLRSHRPSGLARAAGEMGRAIIAVRGIEVIAVGNTKKRREEAVVVLVVVTGAVAAVVVAEGGQ